MPATLLPNAPPVRPTRAGRRPVESPPPTDADRIPPLGNGDRLKAREFMRRYEATPEGFHAELIDGTVYVMASPVSHADHGRPHARLSGWMMTYAFATPGLNTGDNSTVELDDDNLPQPDLFMFIPHDRGGQARTHGTIYVTSAPELACEVSASSAAIDLNQKLETYRRNGVREYVVWRTFDGEIDYFILRDGRYERLMPDDDGITRSEVFPGLWLDSAALVRGDVTTLVATLRRGIDSPEHAAFAARVKP